MRCGRWEAVIDELQERVRDVNDPHLTAMIGDDPTLGVRVELVGNVFRRLTARNRPLHLGLYDALGARDKISYAHDCLERLMDDGLERRVEALRSDLYPVLVRSLGDKAMIDDLRDTMDLGHIVLDMVSRSYAEVHGGILNVEVRNDAESAMLSSLDVLWDRQCRSLGSISVEPPMRGDGLEDHFDGCHIVDSALRGFFGGCFIEHVYSYSGAE